MQCVCHAWLQVKMRKGQNSKPMHRNVSAFWPHNQRSSPVTKCHAGQRSYTLNRKKIKRRPHPSRVKQECQNVTDRLWDTHGTYPLTKPRRYSIVRSDWMCYTRLEWRVEGPRVRKETLVWAPTLWLMEPCWHLASPGRCCFSLHRLHLLRTSYWTWG